MCQYMAEAGMPNEWHHVHLGARAIGGAGLIVAEATAVSPEGRITWADTGVWSDAHTEAWRPIVSFMKAHGAVPGIQIAHAGRKASANRPWEGDDHLPGDHANGWEIIGPTGEAFGVNLPRAPREMTVADIHRVTKDFVAAAKRAADAGFEWLELHLAHGYLAQSFFSPLVNTRTDEYGGSFAGRARFILETLAAVREVWPARLPLTARLGVVDFVPGEQPFAESIELVRLMKEGGLDLVDVSHGINTKDAGGRVPWGKPAFLRDHAKQIRDEVKIPTALSWGAGEAHLANELVATGRPTW
jgi:2,4-dienoyl-CoA reductase-like NADH-dependent reductase (Old Yellow Enzyme family)